MKNVFVVNYDESVIFKTKDNIRFYDDHYPTFGEAKKELIAYWENVLSKAKTNLSYVKKLKVNDVKSFIDDI